MSYECHVLGTSGESSLLLHSLHTVSKSRAHKKRGKFGTTVYEMKIVCEKA